MELTEMLALMAAPIYAAKVADYQANGSNYRCPRWHISCSRRSHRGENKGCRLAPAR